MLRFELLPEVLLFLNKFCLFLVALFYYYFGAVFYRERSFFVADKTLLELLSYWIVDRGDTNYRVTFLHYAFKTTAVCKGATLPEPLSTTNVLPTMIIFSCCSCGLCIIMCVSFYVALLILDVDFFEEESGSIILRLLCSITEELKLKLSYMERDE